MENKREVWVDWLRVVACFLVLVVHSTEPFYLGGDGSQVLTAADAWWVAFFDTLARACVPLFVIASSYLLFPLKYNAGEFVRRRAGRILVPFVIWTCVYALVWGEPVQNFKDLLLNFNYSAGHLWFVYMLIGLYIIMPMLSPWAERVSRRELAVYLGLCFFTTFIPFIREACIGEGATVIYGTGGLPRQADFPLWGEASWNGYGTFYYVSGFIGYLLLGLYLRRFVGELDWKRTLAVSIPCLLAGFAICFFGFHGRVMASSGGVFPYNAGLEVAVGWETPLFNDTVGVALMSVACVLLLRKANSDGGFFRKVVLPVSKASYGMYLCHMLVLAAFSGLFRGALGTGADGCLGVMTTPVEIVLTAVCSYVCVAVACVLVQRIPRLGKWVIG